MDETDFDPVHADQIATMRLAAIRGLELNIHPVRKKRVVVEYKYHLADYHTKEPVFGLSPNFPQLATLEQALEWLRTEGPSPNHTKRDVSELVERDIQGMMKKLAKQKPVAV